MQYARQIAKELQQSVNNYATEQSRSGAIDTATKSAIMEVTQAQSSAEITGHEKRTEFYQIIDEEDALTGKVSRKCIMYQVYVIPQTTWARTTATYLKKVLGEMPEELSMDEKAVMDMVNQMMYDARHPTVMSQQEKEQELAAAEAELEDVHVKLTQFELTDDSAQRDMFERFVDDFTEVLTGEKSYVKYESNCEAFMPLHVEMNSDILTIAQTTVQNGDLMYDPRIDFKVDYENKKVIPLNFENSFQGVYEEYDISDGKPETMKQINDILAFADDWMDEIEVQGYSPVTGDEEIQQTKDNISR